MQDFYRWAINLNRFSGITGVLGLTDGPLRTGQDYHIHGQANIAEAVSFGVSGDFNASGASGGVALRAGPGAGVMVGLGGTISNTYVIGRQSSVGLQCRSDDEK